MLEPLPVWQATLKALQPTDQMGWTRALSRWMGERTTTKLSLTPAITGNVTYTFNVGLFDSTLRTCLSTDKPFQAAQQLASAWEAATLASPMIVLPGSSLMAPSPATTWSVVTSFVDPASVAAAKVVLIQGLLSAQAVSDGYLSKMAEAFRNAFLTLTCTATGMNSLPIPTPLLSPMTKTS